MPKADFVPATKLQLPCPTTLKKSLDPSHPDSLIWKDSYDEEYNSLRQLEVYEEITWQDYHKIQYMCGCPIPTMCVLTIKHKDGYAHRVKSRIVVLGNQQTIQYQLNQKYAPVLTQTQFRLILSLTVQHKRYLCQGDVKNAFCNGTLPDDEVVVV